MTKRDLFTGAAFIGLAATFAATPAVAQDTDNDTIATDARGTFEGFTAAPRLTTRMMVDPASLVLPDFDAEIVRPEPEIISRPDVGLGGSVDADNTQPSVVQIFLQRNSDGELFFNCTGTMINPRTVLTAAHCLNFLPSEIYGGADAPISVRIGTGVDTQPQFDLTDDTGATYAEGGLARSSDVVIHASSNLENGALPFPWADVALVALDAPITDVPYMPVLLTPLTELTHVIQVGYGGFGTADTGDTGIGYLRRVGENMLGALASPANFVDEAFFGFAPSSQTLGFESQVSYWTDFDNPDRTPDQADNCTFTGFGISCNSLADVFAIDWFEDDALDNEVATAGGDSGSPLIADELNGPPVIIGVLSGGFDFFGIGNRFSDTSFYAPLFPFFEFISENTAYKYVSAKEDGGVWSDPTYWTQDLDPGFLVDDGTGQLVNGLPEGPEPGIYASTGQIGTVLGRDISTGSDTQLTAGAPPPGTPNFGANTPNSSVLLGPGSTGFVPNNTDGTRGTAFANPAQYFDVILNRTGTTDVDMDVVIDKLTLDNRNARFRLPVAYDFTAVIGVEQMRGDTDIDGDLNAGYYILGGGLLEGSGTITTSALMNLAGGIAPADLNKVGVLTIDGDYVQTSAGSLVVDARYRKKGNTSDLLSISGDASLAGNLFVSANGRPRFGDEVTVLSANAIVGEFDNTILLNASVTLTAESVVDGNTVDVVIGAREIGSLVSADSNLQSLGAALDTIRFSGRYAQFANLFDIVDNAGFNAFLPTLSSLAPTSAFEQSMIATSFSNRFTGQIAQRTLALRGQGKAAGGFSAAGNAGFAIGGTAPQETGKLGFFGSFSGSFLEEAQANRNTGEVAFQEATLSPAGEMTLGADLALSDTVSIGMAVTNIRNSSVSDGLSLQPEDSSVAGAAYGAVQLGNAFIDMHAGYARQTFGVERASVGDFSRAFTSAVGDAEGEQAFAGVRAGYAFDLADGIKMGPVASLDYVRTTMGGYSEFGAGEFGLDVAKRSFTSLGSKIGAMASLDTRLGQNGSLTAFGSVAYARELGDSQDVVTASFIGAPDALFSIANQLDPEWVSVNAGAQLSLGDDLSLSLSGSSDFGRGPLTNQEGRVSFNWKF